MSVSQAQRELREEAFRMAMHYQVDVRQAAAHADMNKFLFRSLLWDRAKEVVWERDGGVCRLCCECDGQDVDHRYNRGMGGSWSTLYAGVCNLVLLCRDCHTNKTLATGLDRRWFVDNGWIVEAGDDPETVPLIDLLGNRWILETDGSRLPA